LRSLARFDFANRSVRQSVQSHTYLDCSYSTRHQVSLICSCTMLWRSDECVTPLF